MRYSPLAAIGLLGLLAAPALAQTEPTSTQASNIVSTDTRSDIAPALPGSALGDSAGAHDYLKAAREALAAGHTGQAQEALERAETRALDRSVVATKGGDPSSSPLVAQIHDALDALGHGNTAHAIVIIDQALAG